MGHIQQTMAHGYMYLAHNRFIIILVNR